MESLLRRLYRFIRPGQRKKRPIRTRHIRPYIEALEGRLTPSGGSGGGGGGGGGGSSYVWNGAGADNLASDALNWVGDVEPTAADTIIFNGTSSKPAIFDGAFTVSVAGMEVDAAYASSISVQENFTVTGSFTQSGSTLSLDSGTGTILGGVGTANLELQAGGTVNGGAVWGGDGTAKVDGPGVLDIGAGGQTINATTSVIVQQITFTGGGTLTNDGTIEMPGNGNTVTAGTGGGTFENNGSFLKTQSAQADQISVQVPFTNAGTLQVETGIMAFTTAAFTQTDTGTVNVQAGGGGEVRGGNMTFSGGTLTGDGILRATADQNATLTWDGTDMGGTGNVIISPGVTMVVTDDFTDLGFTITNNNLVRWQDGDITLGNGATINNQPGATFRIESNATMDATGGTATFNNYGTVSKPGAAVAGPTEIVVVFNNLQAAGQLLPTVDVEFGSIGFRGIDQNGNGGTIQGILNAASGALLEFGSSRQTFTVLDGTALTGSGTIRVTGGAQFVLPTGATVTNSSSTTFEVGGFSDFTNNAAGILFGGNFTNNGTSNWRWGAALNVKWLNNGRLNLRNEDVNGLFVIDSTVITNIASSTVAWTEGDFLMTSTNANQPSLIDNQGTFDVQTGNDLRDDPNALSAGIVNESSGIFQKSAGTSTTIEVAFTTSGYVNLSGWSIAFQKGVTQTGGGTSLNNGTLTAPTYSLSGGTLSLGDDGQGALNVAGGLFISAGATFGGFGTVTGNVNNSGTIDFALGGPAPGVLNITGNFLQFSTGTLRMRLQAVQNQQYDQLDIVGNANLAGNLQVSALPGFTAVAGNWFYIIQVANGGKVDGDFNSPYGLPPLGAGLSWGTIYGNGGIQLTVNKP